MDAAPTMPQLPKGNGVRAGEACALSLSNIEADRIHIKQSVWNGELGTPKTQNSIRAIALSAKLSALIQAQAENQRERKHNFFFSTSTGRSWDQNNLRQRKLHPLLSRLGIDQMGWHAFRHFNASELDRLGVSERTISDRQGRLANTSLTHTTYIHSNWKQNQEAANRLSAAIENALNSVTLSAPQREGIPVGQPEALESKDFGCGGWI
jgi:integrase